MNSANRTALFVFTLASLAWNVPAAAQEDPGAEQLVDRIIAIVGDSAILMSEVEQGLGLLAARGWTRPTDPDQLLEVRRNILDQLIDEQLMAQDAAQDTTIIVDSEQVDDAVDQEIEAQVQRFGTQGAFQIALEQQEIGRAHV